jgi:hypothetical protein
VPHWPAAQRADNGIASWRERLADPMLAVRAGLATTARWAGQHGTYRPQLW